MPVQDKETLKGYFNDGDVPTESNYEDLIDSMGDGDMKKSVYDPDDDGKITPEDHTHPGTDITSKVGDADTLDGIDSSRIVYGTNTTKTIENQSDMNAAHNSGFYNYSSPNGRPFDDWFHWFNSRHSNEGAWYTFQLASAFHSDNFYLRRIYSGTVGAWNRVFTSQDHLCTIARYWSVPTIINTVWTPVTYDNANDNPFGMFSMGSPTRITIQAAGVYLARANLAYQANGNGDRGIGIKVNAGGNSNNGSWKEMHICKSSASYGTILNVITHPLRLNIGDHIEVFTVQNSGGSLNLDVNSNLTGHNTFTVERIR